MPSTSSSLTTIFDGNSEPRYEELRAERKLISKAIKDFQEKRRKFDAVTDEDLNTDFGLVDEGMDVRAGLFVLDTNIFVVSRKKMVMGHVGINVQTFRSLMNKFQRWRF